MLRLAHHLLVGAAIQLALERLRGKFAIIEAGSAAFHPPLPPDAEISVYELRKLKNGLAP